MRRNLEQVMHCIQEALSVVTHKEDPEHALGDVDQAIAILTKAIRPSLDYQVWEAKKG